MQMILKGRSNENGPLTHWLKGQNNTKINSTDRNKCFFFYPHRVAQIVFRTTEPDRAFLSAFAMPVKIDRNENLFINNLRRSYDEGKTLALLGVMRIAMFTTVPINIHSIFFPSVC